MPARKTPTWNADATAAAHMDTEADSPWLLRWLTRFVLALLAIPALLWIFIGWPAEKVGNAYQLLGLLIAAFQIPTVSPGLAGLERRIEAITKATAAWLAATVRAIKHWLRRLFRRSTNPSVHVAAMSGTAHASGGVSAVVTTSRNPETADLRALVVRHDRELVELVGRVDALEKSRVADRADVQRGIDALRVELQQHVLSVTREGWQYIAIGAAVTAGGILISLAA